MTTTPVETLGSIFADPVAYSNPDAWHAAAKRILDEAPIPKFRVDGSPEFWATTKHAEVYESERTSDVFTTEPLPTLAPASTLAAAEAPPVKTLIQMDGEEHKANRNIVNDWFKPKNV